MISRTPRQCLRTVLGAIAPALVLILPLTGCQSARDNPAAAAAASAEPPPVESTAPSSPVAVVESAVVAGGRPDRETWEAIFIEGDKVGHAHLAWTELDDGLTQISSESQLTLKRFGQTVSSRMTAISIETPEGKLVRCVSAMNQGAGPIETTARVDGDQLFLATRTEGKTLEQPIPWDPSWGGYFVDQVSLQREPMQPGEKRTLRGLVVMFNQVGEYTLEAIDHEMVELLARTERLLRIEGSIQFGGAKIDTVVWANDDGQTLKTTTSFSGFEQSSYRTTKEVALRDSAHPRFDLGRQTIVKTDRQLDAPHQTQRIIYAVSLADKDPAQTFASGGSQQVERVDEQNARLTVRAMRPGDQPAEARGDEPTAADRDSNNLIQSDNPLIVEMAQQVGVAADDPWTLACALERYVHDTVQTKSFTQAMASAADVAKSLEGDCTEHSVLLAALCRARQIPARVAIGLVYYRQAGGFAYHMWNEVWIRDRWIPLDATLGIGGIGAGHIKVVNSNLAGVSPYGALLPVLNVLGQDLRIQIVVVE